MNMKHLYLFILFSLLVMMVIPQNSEAAGWVEVQTATFEVDSGTNWTTIQEAWFEVDSSDPTWVSIQESEFTVDTRDHLAIVNTDDGWLMFMVWAVILWLPALLLGMIAPGYGTVVGLVAMGAMMFIMDSTFIVVLGIILIGGALLFWRGLR